MKFFDLHVRFLFLTFLLLSPCSVVIAQNEKANEELSRSFRKFNIIRITNTQTESFSGSGKSLQLFTDSGPVELNVTPNDLRSPNYRAENTGPAGSSQLDSTQVTTFRGKVAGRDDSEVRPSR